MAENGELALSSGYLDLATVADYELSLAKHGSNSIFKLLQPGQEVELEEGKYWLDDDLDLLVDDD